MKIYRGYDQTDLDQQYNNQCTVPDYTVYVQRYERMSVKARARLACELDIAYGTSADELMDLYLAPADNAPVQVFIHGGGWRQLSKDVSAFAPRARLGIADRMTEAYDLFPLLADRRRQLGGTLSGGEQQMLALARGLMALPRLLLLDEPSLGLAPQAAAEIFDIIEKLSSTGLTIVLAEQDIYRSLMLAHQAYVFEHGRISFEGSGNELLTDPRIRVAYLGVEPAKL